MNPTNTTVQTELKGRVSSFVNSRNLILASLTNNKIAAAYRRKRAPTASKATPFGLRDRNWMPEERQSMSEKKSQSPVSLAFSTEIRTLLAFGTRIDSLNTGELP
jgi:hypothetical protein